MRKLLILAILATMVVMGHDAQAAGRRVRPQVSSGQGPVSQLISLERRKNAYLKQAIFGR